MGNLTYEKKKRICYVVVVVVVGSWNFHDILHQKLEILKGGGGGRVKGYGFRSCITHSCIYYTIKRQTAFLQNT